MTTATGFQVQLFAAEPDVVQPIAFALDDRGRLWVVECLSYPDWLTEGTGHDRVSILADDDGDGRFDRKTVFFDRGTNLSGIELGFGGVWLCSTPNLLFLPDHDGDDVPDGPPQVVLDGWDLKARHNVFNGLTWGPDGWLYGCNGILSNSRVGSPGTPDEQRSELNCGVWRFHPTDRRFEVVAHGTTNPWGLDFDESGEMFITNCVIQHLWHVVPGAHFQRMFGQDLTPHLYQLLDSCADHIHWGGGRWQESRGGQGIHDTPGGGHAHAGAMIYLGDNWPRQYRNHLFTCNIHGNRVNQDLLERKGSSYVAQHGPDFLLANDSWFRGLELKCGPDGGVYLTDWNDTGECHDYENTQRQTGRIYKITYGQTRAVTTDLRASSDERLVELQLHANDWYVRHARRILQERAAAGSSSGGVEDRLRNILRDDPRADRKLRAMWGLQVTGKLSGERLAELLDSEHDTVRSWAVRLMMERSDCRRWLEKLQHMARSDDAPRVRLYLASGLQRLPADQRWPIITELVQHGEDASDPYLPLMIWYAIEPTIQADQRRALASIPSIRLPLVRRFMARRITELGQSGVDGLLELLLAARDHQLRLDVLEGINSGLAGRRQVPMPARWPTAYGGLVAGNNAAVVEAATLLGVRLGDATARDRLRQLAVEAGAPAAARQRAIGALADSRDEQAVSLLHRLVEDPAVRGAALRNLAAFDDPRTPQVILRHYGSLTAAERQDALGTLASRPGYADTLLEALERDRVPRRDLSAFLVRQLAGLGRDDIRARLEKIWGAVDSPSAQKAARIAEYKQWLTPDYIEEANRNEGRAVFSRTCASCHRLFGDGGSVGPDLTGSQRMQLDYVLENLLDPNALVAREFQMTIVVTADGRVITGLVREEHDDSLTLQTPREQLVIPKTEIDQRNSSNLSMMPEGMLDRMTHEEVRNLISYLASPVQVDLPGGSSR